MVKSKINIENARIGFRNFSGKEGKYNPVGNRNFCVFLDQKWAEELADDGWNIRWLEPRDDQEEKQGYLQVAVRFDDSDAKKNPKILMMARKGKSLIDADSVSILDWAEIETVDLVIRPYNWVTQEGTKAEKRGTKAYLQSMYITIVEDEFESKYQEIPDSAHGSVGGCGNCEACDGSCHHDD